MIVEVSDYTMYPMEGIPLKWNPGLNKGQVRVLEGKGNPKAVMETAVAQLLLYRSLVEHGKWLEDGSMGIWQNLNWKIGPCGKPEIPEIAPLEFNLSHSGRLSACAWGRGACGLDIQLIGRVRESVARRFFCQAEKELLEVWDNREQAFHLIWSRREAVVKYIGSGLSQDMSGIRWERIHESWTEPVKIVDDVYLNDQWLCRSASVVWRYCPDDDEENGDREELYAITVCSEEAWDGQVRFRDVDLEMEDKRSE